MSRRAPLRHVLPLLIAAALSVACGGPAQKGTAPSHASIDAGAATADRAAGVGLPAATEATAKPPCERAREQRARVPVLRAQWKLDRMLRVIAHANALCPAEAASTWADEVWALADLGRHDEAGALADRISRASDAPKDATAAAVAAKQRAAEKPDPSRLHLVRVQSDDLFRDPAYAHMFTIWREAQGLVRAADWKGARDKFVEAWNAYHPSPGALVGAGLMAKRIGDPEAQHFFDRAIVELEEVEAEGKTPIPQSARIRLDLPNEEQLGKVESMRWSRDGKSLALVTPATGRGSGESYQIAIVNPVTRRVTQSIPFTGEPEAPVQLSPDASKVAILSGHRVAAFNARTRDRLPLDARAEALAFRPDGSLVAYLDGTLTTYNAETGEPIGKPEPVPKPTEPDAQDDTTSWIGADGRFLLSCAHTSDFDSATTGPAYLYAVGSRSRRVRVHASICPSFSADGTRLWAPDGKSVIVWRNLAAPTFEHVRASVPMANPQLLGDTLAFVEETTAQQATSGKKPAAAATTVGPVEADASAGPQRSDTRGGSGRGASSSTRGAGADGDAGAGAGDAGDGGGAPEHHSYALRRLAVDLAVAHPADALDRAPLPLARKDIDDLQATSDGRWFAVAEHGVVELFEVEGLSRVVAASDFAALPPGTHDSLLSLGPALPAGARVLGYDVTYRGGADGAAGFSAGSTATYELSIGTEPSAGDVLSSVGVAEADEDLPLHWTAGGAESVVEVGERKPLAVKISSSADLRATRSGAVRVDVVYGVSAQLRGLNLLAAAEQEVDTTSSDDKCVVRLSAGYSDLVLGLRFLDDGRLVALGRRGDEIVMSDVGTGAAMGRTPFPGLATSSAAIDARGMTWAVGAADGVLVGGAPGPAVVELVGAYGSWPNPAAIAPQGTIVATSASDGHLDLWDAAGARRTAELHAAGTVTAMSFAPDGSRLFYSTIEQGDGGSATRAITAYDLASQKSATILRVDTERCPIDAIAARPGGAEVAYAADTEPRNESGALLGAGPVPELTIVDGAAHVVRTVRTGDQTRTISFRGDGKVLATASYDGVTKLWSADDAKQLLLVQTFFLSADARHGGASDPLVRYVVTPTQQIDFDERARPFLLPEGDAPGGKIYCRVGARTYDFDLCEERFYTHEAPGLAARVVAGDTTYADP